MDIEIYRFRIGMFIPSIRYSKRLISNYRNTDLKYATAKRSVNGLFFMIKWIIIVTALIMVQKNINRQRTINNGEFKQSVSSSFLF